MPHPLSTDQDARHWSGGEPATCCGLLTLCQLVAAGRRAARHLSDCLRPFSLSEAEFRLLWRLQTCDGCAGDAGTAVTSERCHQTSLAHDLELSPAQVSALVEQLRASDWIAGSAAPEDRRRRVWRLTPHGRLRLETVVDKLAATLDSKRCPPPPVKGKAVRREEAA